MRHTTEKGAALLEMALVFVALLAMIIFVLNMGGILMMQQFYAERARAGARVAAVTRYDPAAIRNYVCFNSLTAPAGGPKSGLFGLKPSMVTVQRLGTPGKWDDRINVTLSHYSVTLLVPWLTGVYGGRPLTATVPVQSLGSAD